MISNIKLSEVKGENKKRIFDILGLQSSTTDYSRRHIYSDKGYVLSDGVQSMTFDEEYEYILDFDREKPKTPFVDREGKISTRNTDNPLVGIRLSGKYSDIKESAKIVEDLGNGIKVVEYGEYPVLSVSEIQGQKYYEVDREKTFLETGKTYWVPNLDVQIYRSPLYEPHVIYRAKNFYHLIEERPELLEYLDDYSSMSKYEGYIEIKEYVDCEGNKYVEYKGFYYMVQPVRWYVDETEDYEVTVNTIAGGVPHGNHHYISDQLVLDKYSVDYFVKEMLISDLTPSVVMELPERFEPVIEEVEERVVLEPLPNLDNLTRQQLVALQKQIAELLSKQNQESAYVPKLTM